MTTRSGGTLSFLVAAIGTGCSALNLSQPLVHSRFMIVSEFGMDALHLSAYNSRISLITNPLYNPAAKDEYLCQLHELLMRRKLTSTCLQFCLFYECEAQDCDTVLHLCKVYMCRNQLVAMCCTISKAIESVEHKIVYSSNYILYPTSCVT